MKKILIFAFVLLINGSLLAQDYHFSQFYASPMAINPALTGFFNGDFRVIGNYRDQWRSMMSTKANSFKTIAASFDINIPVINKSFAGVGVAFYSDKAGDLKFGTTYFALSGSYSHALNMAGNQFLSAGAQFGFSQRNMDPSAMTTDNMWDGAQYNPALGTGEPSSMLDKYNFFDISTGLMWSYTPSKRFSSYIGFSLSHLTQPNQSFFTNTDDDNLYVKLAVHGGGDYALNDNMAVVPSVLFLKQGPATETNIGSYLKFTFGQDPKATDPAFFIGPWFRIVGDEYKAVGSDAVIMALRVDYMNFSGGFSYDINVSGLTPATSSKGGPEFSLAYIGNIKKREGRRNVTCPRF